MSRLQKRYVCTACGHESLRWMGRCPECDVWDSLVEEVTAIESAPTALRKRHDVHGVVATGSGRPVSLTEVPAEAGDRLTSGIPEFDRVLGGGAVPGSVVLVGGDPGIGKSTLLTQVSCAIAASNTQGVLYVSGEESAQQIALRSRRLGAIHPRVMVLVDTDAASIIHYAEQAPPALVIVDSIQTMSDSALDSIPGSVSQVRACASHFARFARSSKVPVVLIGHVTKEGSLAGPRVLEHLVDTVLAFEGDHQHAYRILRAVKNRFGSTDELGLFQMHEQGLLSVENPSAALLAERPHEGSGSAVTAVLEGSRALLVEIQGLASRSFLASPRRVTTGFDPNRINMLLAVLEKRLGLRLAEQDVFVNAAGGVRISEPAADLAAAAAVASSFRDQAVEQHTVLIGEVGLAGEVRAVAGLEKRLKEAARQGFRQAVVPRYGHDKLPIIPGIRLVAVENVQRALQVALVAPTSHDS